MSAAIENIKELIKNAGLRVTQPRIDVASILERNKGKLLTPEEIYLKIKNSKTMQCDQASVYRVLTKFEELGIVTKNTFQGEASRYMIDNCGHTHKHHHHFFKCTKCKKIEPLDGCFFTAAEKKMKDRGYSNLNHHIEVTGTCPKCTK